MKIRLKYWRQRRLMTIRELAEKARIATSTIVQIEKSGNAPRPSTLKKILTALDVSVDEMLDPINERNEEEDSELSKETETNQSLQAVA